MIQFRSFLSKPALTISVICAWGGSGVLADTKTAGHSRDNDPSVYSITTPKEFEKKKNGPEGILSDTVSTIPEDQVNIIMGPFRNPTFSAVWFGGSVALLPFDQITTKFSQDKIEPHMKFTPPPIIDTQFTQGSDGYLIAGLGVWYLASLGAHNSKGQIAALLGFKSVIYAYVYDQLILKSIFGRNRPGGLSSKNIPGPGFSNNQYDFGNTHLPYFSSKAGGASYPSFHWTLGFSFARVFEKVYDNSIIPYTALAIFMVTAQNCDGCSSWGGNAHWVSDMFAGAVVGYGIGSAIVNTFNERTKGKNYEKESTVSFTPILDNENNFGLVVEKKF